MGHPLLDRILPRGPELLRRIALAEVLGPPPGSVKRREEQRERERAERGAPAPAPSTGPDREG